jgi:hypothetical protein
MTTTRAPRPPVRPDALERARAFGALEAIFTRRSRRFPLGGALSGPLAFVSEREPVPLAEAEEALLVAAATGVTGVACEEWPFTDADGAATGSDKLGSFTGRAVPSPLANHNVELFWTNDDGVFALPTRDRRPEPHGHLLEAGAPHALYAQAVRLQPERLLIPKARPNLFGFNRQLPNLEGTTLFMPVSDVTRQCITALLLYFDAPHGVCLVDRARDAAPLREFVASGLLDPRHPVDLADFERWQMVDANGVEQGLVVQSLMLATQALGLGGYPFSGGKGRVTLGGERHWHAIGGEGPCGSLGFAFHTAADGEEIPVGLPGVLEGACPPFHADMDAAVDHVLDLRYGPEGIWTEPGRRLPWRADVRPDVPRPSAEAIACTKAWCRYVWDAYGRFPATIDPMLMTVWYQAHHLDVDFYDRHYPHEAVPEHVRNHMADWHGDGAAARSHR